MKIEEVLAFLEEHASEKYKKNVVKLGIPEEETIGVATADLRKLAKKMPKEKVFIQALWHTGYHECKMLAVLALRPSDFSKEETAAFMEEIHSWDLCDLFCKTVLIEKPDYEEWINDWSNDDRLYYKRGAFTLIASTSTRVALTKAELERYLELIRMNSDDDRLLVKKAVSWALRELGKTGEEAKERSIATAVWLTEQASKAQQWIGKDALKELPLLVKVSGRTRLISSKSKMGKEAQQ